MRSHSGSEKVQVYVHGQIGPEAPHNFRLRIIPAAREAFELPFTNAGSGPARSSQRSRNSARWRRTSTAASHSWVQQEHPVMMPCRPS